MVLNKTLALYDRSGEGVLIPQEVPLSMTEKDKENYPDMVGQKIRIIPLTRGEIKVMFALSGKESDEQPDTTKDEDGEIIVKYCKSPAFTLEELAYAKPVIVRSIVRTIFEESGITFDDKAGTKRIDDNDEFGKNSKELDEKKKKDV